MAVEILSPLDYQVFQRDGDGQAVIPVVIEAPRVEDQVQARLLLLPTYTEYRTHTGETTDWVDLAATAGGFKSGSVNYAGKLTGKAGGWYRLEVRVAGDNSTSWKQTPGASLVGPCYPLTDYYQRPALVMHVGIGDVFICAGQSNSANSGWPPQLPQDERVVCFDGSCWRPAYDPQPLATNHGGSPWPILGDMLVRSLQVPIALISTGQGGTKAGTWQPLRNTAPLVERPNPDRDAKSTYPQPGQGPYLQLSRLAKMLGPKGVKAVLWHQGYSDARDGTTSEQYVQSMINIIESLNSDAGYRIPWMVAQEAVAPYPESDSQAIRHGQQALWNSPLVYQGPTTDDMLGPKFRHDMDHFNELGLRIHAERWFAMLWSQFYAVVPIGVSSDNS